VVTLLSFKRNKAGSSTFTPGDRQQRTTCHTDECWTTHGHLVKAHTRCPWSTAQHMRMRRITAICRWHQALAGIPLTNMAMPDRAVSWIWARTYFSSASSSQNLAPASKKARLSQLLTFALDHCIRRPQCDRLCAPQVDSMSDTQIQCLCVCTGWPMTFARYHQPTACTRILRPNICYVRSRGLLTTAMRPTNKGWLKMQDRKHRGKWRGWKLQN